MKKIILLIVTIFVLSSCGLQQDNETEDKKSNKNKTEVKISENEKITKLEDLVNKQKFDEAIPELKKYYEKNPNDIDNILNYSSALLDKGSITRQEKEYSKRALDILNKALKKYPNNSEIYRYIGYAYEIAEDYDNSFNAYDKSIKLNPDNAMAYANRGHAYRLYGDYEKAIKDFEKAYDLDSNNSYIIMNLASIYLGDRNTDEALKLYKKAIELSKSIRFKAEAYHSIGTIYILKGEYDKAEEAFNNAIKADSNFELGYLGVAKALMNKIIYNGDKYTKEEIKEILKKATAYNQMAIKLNPTRVISYFNLALMLKDFPEYKKQSGIMFKLADDAIDKDNTLDKNAKNYYRKKLGKILKEYK